MRVLRGTLSFVLGMIIGIILFVLAIGGTVVALGTAISIGDLQNKLNVDIIQEDSDIYDMSILDTVKTVISDVKNFSSMSLQEIINKYGVPLPSEIAGINISQAYQYPLTEVSSHIDEIVNSIPLEDVLNVAGIDELDLPIITDNQSKGISDAISSIVNSINSDISIRDIKNNFGIDVGAEDNIVLSKLQDLPLSQLGSTINYLRVCDLVNANTDLYVSKSSSRYIKVDIYEEVTKTDLKNTSYSPISGVDTYIAGSKDANNDGEEDSLIEKELRFVKVNDSYKVDNSCYEVGFNADESTKQYYRHYSYKLANGTTGTDYYVKAYANIVDSITHELIFVDFVKVDNSSIITFTNSNPTIAYAVPPQVGYSLVIDKLEQDDVNPQFIQYQIGDASSIIKTIAYKTIYDLQNDTSFIDDLTLGEIITIDDSSSQIVKSLEDKKIGELDTAVDDLLLNEVITIDDSSSQILKALQNSKIGELSTAVDSLKLKEVITIDDSSSQILKTLQDTTISDLSTAIDDLILDEVMTIIMDDFSLDADGMYIKVEENNSFYYTMYNPAIHTDASIQRYSRTEVTDSSSKVLQRLRSTKINAFSEGFEALVLSDVLDITPDLFEAVSYSSPAELEEGKQYYYYDSAQGLYLSADDTYISTHNLVFNIAVEGTGSKVIRKLAYVKIDDLSTAMETVMDDLLLSDVVDVTMDEYTVDNTNGIYAKVYENGSFYYTIYNTATHSGDKYTRTPVVGASSKILQRLANTNIGKFSDSFDELVLSDVIDIDPDIYEQINYTSVSELDEETTYYYYDETNNLYTIADSTYRSSHNTLYRVSKEGSGTKFLRKVTFVKINDLSTAIDIVIDDLLLADLVSITMDEYSEDPDGMYAKITVDGSSYYTIYNPAIHSGARYVKTPVVNSSSKVLQRLANTKIADLSDNFKGLVLADVIDITPSLYEKVVYSSSSDLSSSIDYYYYDETDGLFLLADDTYINSHTLVYRIVKSSTDSKIMQKLAYVKIDNLNTAIEKVIDDMFLSDILDIVENYAVELVSGSPSSLDEKFLIESTELDGSGDAITYVYNSNGKYVKRGYSIEVVDTSSLTPTSTKTVRFVQVASQEEAKTYAIQARLYYSSDNGTTIVYNPELATYIATKTSYDQTVDGAKLYYSVDDTTGPKTYNIYDNSANDLYVLILGQYQLYNPSNYMHIAQDKIYQKVSGDCYVNIGNPTPVDDPSYAYNSSSDILLSKVYCETIYVADNAGTYVFYDNSYVLFDSTNTDHQSLQKYSTRTGYIASTSEAFYKDSSDHYQSYLSPHKINIINEKSANVLIMLKNNKTTVTKMSETIDNAKLKDLIEIEPDSIFSIEYIVDSTPTSLKECSINELSSAITDMMNVLSIGDFLDLANIHTIQPQVKIIIDNIKLPKFFSSLKYNATTGMIYLDIEALYA